MSDVNVKLTRAEAEFLFHHLMDGAQDWDDGIEDSPRHRQAVFQRQLASKIAPWLAPN